MSSMLKNNIIEPSITSNSNNEAHSLKLISEDRGVLVYEFILQSDTPFIPSPVVIEWKIIALDIVGLWKPTADFSKRIEADWELDNHESRGSIDAPVLSVYGNNEKNLITFSCSNAINKIEMAAKYREEDNYLYCRMIFMKECFYPITEYKVQIRIDHRHETYSKCLQDTAEWWGSFKNLKPCHVPSIARKPLYSTWYQFHQDLEEELLLTECRLAKSMGFESIILDDGWQTKDNNRGYDYTGDWQPDRFENFPEIVKKIHDIGLKVGLWFSVPFCGVKSKAYQQFSGMFLTENHRWAPVFDPRYPDVRSYLIDIYVNAVKVYNLDGLKLDFIDDFRAYDETSFEHNPNQDFASINEAVDALLLEAGEKLRAINPEIFIEFRQRYIGPAMRKYGNMLRAFDCPGDFTMNRVRIADIRMLAGETAVHADMVKWNFDEKVEYAAQHYLNAFFGVPQLSVMLSEAPIAHQNMIRFYTNYWIENESLFNSQNFFAYSPESNYPIVTVFNQAKKIIGLFQPIIIKIRGDWESIDILNIKQDQEVVLLNKQKSRQYRYIISDCQGDIIKDSSTELQNGINYFSVPCCGLIQLKIVKS